MPSPHSLCRSPPHSLGKRWASRKSQHYQTWSDQGHVQGQLERRNGESFERTPSFATWEDRVGEGQEERVRCSGRGPGAADLGVACPSGEWPL